MYERTDVSHKYINVVVCNSIIVVIASASPLCWDVKEAVAPKWCVLQTTEGQAEPAPHPQLNCLAWHKRKQMVLLGGPCNDYIKVYWRARLLYVTAAGGDANLLELLLLLSCFLMFLKGCLHPQCYHTEITDNYQQFRVSSPDVCINILDLGDFRYWQQQKCVQWILGWIGPD